MDMPAGALNCAVKRFVESTLPAVPVPAKVVTAPFFAIARILLLALSLTYMVPL
jgi:hypothetical protein